MRYRRLVLHAVIGVLPLALAACGKTEDVDPRTQLPLVQVGEVRSASASERSFTGVVAARVQSDLGFRVSGKVLERLVDTGQVVRRGQALMRIDPADLNLALNVQNEAVSAARARAIQTAEDEARYRELVAAGAVSASTYGQLKAAADAAKAQLLAAESQARVAKNAATYAVLYADADGVVVDTLAEPGQVVSAGQVVVRVAHAGQREAVIQLPETLRPVIGSSGQATLYGQEAVSLPAKLRQLSDSADPLTRTFEARYVLQGAQANAPLGSTVTIQLPTSGTASLASVQVPITAVADLGKGPGVWVLAGQPVRVVWRPVHVANIDDEVARLSGGVKLGEHIVTLGVHLLHADEQVRVATNTAETSVASGQGGL